MTAALTSSFVVAVMVAAVAVRWAQSDISLLETSVVGLLCAMGAMATGHLVGLDPTPWVLHGAQVAVTVLGVAVYVRHRRH